MLTARQATATEGILVGESSGTALWAALQVARDVDDPEALFVVLLPDSGRNYIGKLYNDAWLREVGLSGRTRRSADYDWRATHPDVSRPPRDSHVTRPAVPLPRDHHGQSAPLEPPVTGRSCRW